MLAVWKNCLSSIDYFLRQIHLYVLTVCLFSFTTTLNIEIKTVGNV